MKRTNKFANNNIKFHGGQLALPDYLEAELEHRKRKMYRAYYITKKMCTSK